MTTTTHLAEHDDTQQVVVRLQGRLFGLPVQNVREMMRLPAVTPLPHLPPHVLGLLDVRGSVIPIVDLRLRLGMSTADEEVAALVETLHQRERDHVNWLDELTASVRDARPFRLTTDHHACAFGRWYDTFTTSNHVLTSHLAKFDAPHQRIHAVARDVANHVRTGDLGAANALIARTRDTELAAMIKLFGQLRALLLETNRTIAVVLDAESAPFAVAVDEVSSVEWLRPAATEGRAFDDPDPHRVVEGVARASAHADELITLLRVDALHA